MTRPPLVVTGMHRSGTSLTAALLRNAGLDVGTRLLRSDGPRDVGHSEDLDFVELHQDVLRRQGLNPAGWTLEPAVPVDAETEARARALVAAKGARRAWGWKDPRTTLFLDLWHDVVPEAWFLFVYRAPWEVVDSLYRRGDFPFFWTPTLAIAVWTHYNALLLDFVARAPSRCVVAGVAAIAARPRTLVAHLNRICGLGLRPPDPSVRRPGALHAAPPEPEQLAAIQAVAPEALDLYARLVALDVLAPGDAELVVSPCPDGERVFERWMEERRSATLRAAL
jgi:hypothetical protein